MFEWLWKQIERELDERSNEVESRVKVHLRETESNLKGEVELLSAKLISIISSLEGELKKDRERVASRITTSESNINSLHAHVSEQSRILINLRDKVGILQESDAEDKFFMQIKPTLRERFSRIGSLASSFFSRHHFVIVSNVFFILSTAALTWLVISNF